jgi:DNA-binding XRE family transcriptional regulator
MKRITGHQIRSARILAGLSQVELVELAGLTNRQTLIRMEGCGAQEIISNSKTIASVLAALGSHGVALVPGGLIRAGTSCSI